MHLGAKTYLTMPQSYLDGKAGLAVLFTNSERPKWVKQGATTQI
jgi:hypothetical protein